MSGLAIDLGFLTAAKPFDPSFIVLATEASIEAIFLSTFVLISQNCLMGAAAKQFDLDLETNLLAEHELTRLVATVDAIASNWRLFVMFVRRAHPR